MHPDFSFFALEPVLRWLDIAGVSVFAVSGALTATRKQLDIIAACFFAIVAAIGGGTMRDVLIGAPVFWMQAPTTLGLCIAVGIAVWLTPLRVWPTRPPRRCDSLGNCSPSPSGMSGMLRPHGHRRHRKPPRAERSEHDHRRD